MAFTGKASGMGVGNRWRTARARERREVERLVGVPPLRRRARLVERIAAVVVVVICLLGIVGGFFAARGVSTASGRQDTRVTAVTSSRARIEPDAQTAVGTWVADVTATDAAGVVHRGQVSVAGDKPVGTRLPARLTAAGVVRNAPPSALDVVCLMVTISIALAVVVLALSLICHQALGRVAERLRRESWQVAWAQWSPAAPNREQR